MTHFFYYCPELPIWPKIENAYRKLGWGTLYASVISTLWLTLWILSTPDYSNKCFEIPQQETNSVNSCRWRTASTNIWKVDIKYVKKMKTTILCGHYVTFLELFYHMCTGKWQFRSTTSFSVLLRNHYHFVMPKWWLIYISTPLHQGTPVFEFKAEIYSI